MPDRTIVIVLPSLAISGGTLIAKKYAEHLHASGRQVAIAGFHSDPVPDFWGVNLEVIALRPPVPHKMNTLLYCWPGYGTLRALVKRSGPVQLLTIYSPLATILSRIARAEELPDPLFIVHDSPRQKWTGRVSYAFLIPRFIRHHGASSVAVVNHALIRKIRGASSQQWDRSLREIPNGLAKEYFREPGSPANRDPNHLVFVGAPTRAKGWDSLVALARRLERERPAAVITCILARSPRARILPKTLRLIVGVTDPQLLADILDTASYVLSLSRSESFCLPLLEGMARACIPIAIRTLGAEQYIRDGVNGLFLQPNAATEQILQVLSDFQQDEGRAERMRREAQRTASAYRWEAPLRELDAMIVGAHR